MKNSGGAYYFTSASLDKFTFCRKHRMQNQNPTTTALCDKVSQNEQTNYIQLRFVSSTSSEITIMRPSMSGANFCLQHAKLSTYLQFGLQNAIKYPDTTLLNIRTNCLL